MIKAIIFDIDGVLLDSFDSNVRYLDDLLKLAGYGLTRAQYKKMYHLTAWDVIKKSTKLRSHAKIKKIHDLMKILPDKPEYFSKPTKYSVKTIQNLHKKYKIALVSNRTRSNIIDEYFVVAPQLRSYIDTIIAFEDTKKHKPHPEPLLKAARRIRVRPEECIYIGDAPSDQKASQSAGMPFIQYGRKRMRGAKIRIDSFKNLSSVIAKFG